ncbi:hypothetical protein BZ163_33515 [Pseudomonas sp. VI4.1]|nr:hypothetical protein BZ163_33515 [Pseudomonas sp. VI4.1]
MFRVSNRGTCRSELAREGLKGDAFIQTIRVIVDVHREQARSYMNRGAFGPLFLVRIKLFL